MSVPAHKSGTAGQIVTPVGVPAKELVHRGTTVYSPPKSGVNVYEEMRPLKTALEASKSVLAPYPQEPWESRYNRLVGAIRAIEAEYEASVGSDMDIYYATDKIFALVKEKT